MKAPPRLSILHVAAPASAGGLERVVHSLAIGHHERSHRIRVVALIGRGEDGSPFLDPLEAADVEVHTLSVTRTSVLAERRFLRELCLRERPDVVHTHGYRPDIVDGPLAHRLGIPICSTEHGMSFMGGLTTIYEWLQLRSLRRFDAVAAVSRPIASALERTGVPRECIHWLPNAWADRVEFLERGAARRALELPADGAVVGFVGRLIPAKGGDVCLRALARIADLPFRVAMIGDGSERGALEALASSLGIADRVRFYGEITNAAPLFRAFDLFVLSSRTEGSPIVLLEAMAAGVPIAAATVGGVSEALGADEAWLVPAEDPEALAAAMRDALSGRAGAQRRAERASERLAGAYALQPWLDAYEEFYREAIRNRERIRASRKRSSSRSSGSAPSGRSPRASRR